MKRQRGFIHLNLAVIGVIALALIAGALVINKSGISFNPQEQARLSEGYEGGGWGGGGEKREKKRKKEKEEEETRYAHRFTPTPVPRPSPTPRPEKYFFCRCVPAPDDPNISVAYKCWVSGIKLFDWMYHRCPSDKQYCVQNKKKPWSVRCVARPKGELPEE